MKGRFLIILCFFKQKTAYEMRISDWSSDVCSSYLIACQAVSPQGSTVFRTPGDSTSQILQDTQNIRPIVRVNQGTELAITVAKDFDFSQVYGLGLK